MEPTNVNVSCIFDLRSHVIAKLSTAMVVKKLLVDDKYKLKQICLLGVVCNISNRKTLSGKTFCFLEKHVPLIFKFCPLSNLMFFCFFLRAADWSSTNFLGMYCYFNVVHWSTLSKWPWLQ